MPASPQERSRPTWIPLLVGGIQVLIVLACVAHAGRRVWEDTRRDPQLGPWPARQSVANFEWIERRVRALGELGHIHIGGERGPTDYRVALVQNAVVPAVIHLEERPVSVVTFPRTMDRGALRAELAARGFGHVQMRPKSDVGLAGRTGLPPPAAAYPSRAWPVKLAGLALLCVIAALGGLVAARRGGAQAFFGMLLVAPFTLGLAAAAGDALSAPATATALAWIVLSVACALAFRRWRSEPGPRGGPRGGPGGGAGNGEPGGRASRIWLAAALVIVALGITQAVTNFGIHPDGGIDAFRMYNLRARFILRAADFGAPFTTAGYLLTTHADYPPLVPYAVAGAHRLLGGASALAPIWVQSCAWIGGAGLIGLWTLRVAGRVPALTMLALLVCNPFWVRSLTEQVCDVPLALLFGAALVALRGVLSSAVDASAARRAALFCGGFLGLGLLVKNEAAMMTLVLGLVVGAWSLLRWRERRARLAWITLGLAPFVALLIAFETITPVNDLLELSRFSSASVARAARIARAFAGVIVDPMLFKGTFLVVGLAALVSLPSRARDTIRAAPGSSGWELCVSLALCGVIVSLFLVYLVTPHDLAWHLSTSLNRVFAQVLPAAALLGVSLARRT